MRCEISDGQGFSLCCVWEGASAGLQGRQVLGVVEGQEARMGSNYPSAGGLETQNLLFAIRSLTHGDLFLWRGAWDPSSPGMFSDAALRLLHFIKYQNTLRPFSRTPLHLHNQLLRVNPELSSGFRALMMAHLS